MLGSPVMNDGCCSDEKTVRTPIIRSFYYLLLSYYRTKHCSLWYWSSPASSVFVLFSSMVITSSFLKVLSELPTFCSQLQPRWYFRGDDASNGWCWIQCIMIAARNDDSCKFENRPCKLQWGFTVQNLQRCVLGKWKLKTWLRSSIIILLETSLCIYRVPDCL